MQACRANEIEDDGIEEDHRTRLCPPDSSDILIAYSTIEGKLSYRDIYNGSWFIQTLVKQLNTHAQNYHLMDIMTMVNEDIAGSELDGYRQRLVQVSTLTKFIWIKMAINVDAVHRDINNGTKESDGRNSNRDEMNFNWGGHQGQQGVFIRPLVYRYDNHDTTAKTYLI